MNIIQGYEAYCQECGNLSVMPAEEDIHLGLARKHHESTGHSCVVREETKSVVIKGRIPQIVSQDCQVIAVFEKYINKPG